VFARLPEHVRSDSGCGDAGRSRAEVAGFAGEPVAVHRALLRAMPCTWHSTHKNDRARAMVAQTEQAFLAIAQGNAPKEPTVKVLE
jgi:hypothetical protein